MPTVTIDTDVLLSVINTSGPGLLTGSYSEFTAAPHPGTSKTIHGWEWDRRSWPSVEELDQVLVIPSILDPSIKGLDDDFFQSGVGAKDDLEVIDIVDIPASGENRMSPVIRHGHYFIHQRGHYLLADGSRTAYLASGIQASDGFGQVALSAFPKAGVPLQVRRYSINRNTGEYVTDTEFRKRVNFTGQKQEDGSRLSTRNTITDKILFGNVDQTNPEYLLDYSDLDNSPNIIFNDDYTEEIGRQVASASDLSSLDQLGTASSTENQEFLTKYSPIDSTQTINIYTYPSFGGPFTTWTVVNEITGAGQVEIDYDLGIVRFGNNSNGSMPPLAHLVGAHYTRTAAIEYEPENTTDDIVAKAASADTNPIRHISEKGFIFLRREPSDPANISLFAELPLMSPTFGPLFLGSNYAAIKALDRDARGQRIEGQTVSFFFTSATHAGSFAGGGASVSGVTDRDGIATVFYNTPRNINDIGQLTGVVAAGPPGELVVSGVNMTTAAEDVHVYKVFKDDVVVGGPFGTDAEKTAFWNNFFTTESGVQGPTGSDDPALLGGDLDNVWELRHRILRELLIPRDYNRAFRNGRKQIIAVWDVGAIDPHDGTLGAFKPLQPTEITVSGTNSTLVFSGVALDLPGSDDVDLDSYFVVTPLNVNLQASTFNNRLNQTVFSNDINIFVDIPPQMNGTHLIDNINAVPSGLVSWVLNSGHNDRVLPLGFRIRTSGPTVTIAGALNGVTYLDINKPPRLGMAFTVD